LKQNQGEWVAAACAPSSDLVSGILQLPVAEEKVAMVDSVLL
jgi:hypothetical protein